MGEVNGGRAPRGRSQRESPKRGGDAPGAHACGLSYTAELICLPIDGGFYLLNSAFPAAIGP